MDKQKYFYHSSPNCDLKYIEPRKNTVPIGFNEGEVVFATDSLPFSTMFIVPHDDSWANGGTFNDVPYFVISDKERFLKADKGGCIYLVSSKSFVQYNRRELFSKEKIKVQHKIRFESGLMAMIILGVQVYFTDKVTYGKIRKAKDHGLSILNKMVSENEMLGFPSGKLEMYFASKKLVV